MGSAYSTIASDVIARYQVNQLACNVASCSSLAWP